MKRTAILFTVSLFSGLAAWQIIAPPTPRWLYNPSPSAPVGWYDVQPGGAILRDAKVAAYAPDAARRLADERGYLPYHVPLIKSVWAVGGERVCHEHGNITAPNRPDISGAGQDGSGRSLELWQGCRILKANEVFLISTDVQTSWDSRYFGPVMLTNVLGTVRYLGDGMGPFGASGGRARGSGADGKIKAGSAPAGLFPCLHISFGSAPEAQGGAPFSADCPVAPDDRGSAPPQNGNESGDRDG